MVARVVENVSSYFKHSTVLILYWFIYWRKWHW